MALPHAKSSPPWSDCGDPSSPDFGRVFADRPFEGTVGLWFDKATERRFACRVAVADLGDEIVIAGRRFDVVRHDAEAVARAEEALARAEEPFGSLPELPCADTPVRAPAPSFEHSERAA